MSKAADARRKRLRGKVGKAVVDYAMIEEGDRVMACVSGGKDSFVMLDALLHLQRVAPIRFEVVAVNLDQRQPGFPAQVLPAYFAQHGIPYYVIDKDTYSVVTAKIPPGKTSCSLCSRLRRGSLYGFAEQIGATKVALGHHLDDIVETLFLNMIFHGKLKAMPPKLLSDDQRNIVIRPLAYCREKEIAKVAAESGFPIIPCNLCGSQDNLQRQQIRALLAQWESAYPGCIDNLFRSLQQVSPSQLADFNLFDSRHLAIDRSATPPQHPFAGVRVAATSFVAGPDWPGRSDQPAWPDQPDHADQGNPPDQLTPSGPPTPASSAGEAIG